MTHERDELLRAERVRARHGRIEVTHDVSFGVRGGEVLALLGPNGAGKTSLVGCVAGLVKGSGEVRLDGRRIDGLPAPARARRGLALVPEHRGIFPAMRVGEHLALGTRLLPRGEREATADAVLELFPVLRERLRQAAGTLSGGEQQMLAVARALVAQPAVLILDEPTQGLAPRVFDVLIEALRARRAEGLAVVLVEQNQAFAARVADRCLVLTGGRVVHEGDIDVLSDRQAMASSYMGGLEASTSTSGGNEGHG